MSFQVPRSNRRTGGVGSFESTEGARNTENVVRTGKVKEVDLARRLLRVSIGEGQNLIETAWLPVLERSASVTREGMSAWVPPRVDDVVQVSCPGGELSLGFVLTSQFMHANDAPFGDRAEGYEFGDLGDPRDDVWRQLFADGTLIEYDKGQSLVRVETPGSVKVHACGQVIIKSPFIQLDADAVHVTGKLLLSDKVIGMDRNLQQTQWLDFLGDPIKLNDNGGIFGIAGSLISGFGLTTLTDALGNFGNFDGLFGNLVNGLGAPMGLDSFLGGGGLLDFIPTDILGAGMDALGVENLMGPLSSVMGFIENPQALTDPWGMANFALEVADAAGLDVPGGGLVVDGFQTITGWLNGGQINANQLAEVAIGSGLLPTGTEELAATVGSVLNTASSGAGTPNLSPSNLMDGLQSGLTSITNEGIANAIHDNGIVPTWEMLFQGEVDASAMIGSAVSSGQISLEQLLGIDTPLQRSGNTSPTGDCDIRLNQPQQAQQSQAT